MPDQRGGRVVLLSHCLLNENVRYPCVVQLPCPEQRAWGGARRRLDIPFLEHDLVAELGDSGLLR